MKSLQQPALSKLMCVRYSHRVVAAIDMCKFWRVYNSNFGTQLLYISNGEFCATISLHFYAPYSVTLITDWQLLSDRRDVIHNFCKINNPVRIYNSAVLTFIV